MYGALSVIPNRTYCVGPRDRCFTAFHAMGPIIHRQTVELWYEGSENRYGQYLGELRDPAKLRTMAQWICKTQQCRTLS